MADPLHLERELAHVLLLVGVPGAKNGNAEPKGGTRGYPSGITGIVEKE